MPDCHTAPPTAFFGSALQNIMFSAAAVSIMIWMMRFILGMPIAVASVTLSPSLVTWKIWQNAKQTITSNAARKTYTEAFADRVITLSRVVALEPYMYSCICGSASRFWNSGSLSRSLPRW